MKFPRVMPAWQYIPTNVSFDSGQARAPVAHPVSQRPTRDRYYTAARRFHVKKRLREVMR